MDNTPLSVSVHAELHNDGTLAITTDMVGTVTRRTIALEDEAIHHALEALGWLPPATTASLAAMLRERRHLIQNAPRRHTSGWEDYCAARAKTEADTLRELERLLLADERDRQEQKP